ncbi:PLD nuclease N-terminal domain-containing protein [Pseudomonas mangiferae]|uniref:PLDc_N domain-containing protein n=1 Tax=Pseudomonas mangiferae TaxID=2593654 RepID=A0A553H145_9PSED|nr:PLD nuclease N-terminal domain-containing protein [Pseudomonas mangiferae]TRX75460.1 PLDc_N domain-containing protein [Pseudomonas mangiferae]
MNDLMSIAAITLAGAIVVLDLWAIVSVFRSDKDVNVKAVWALAIAVLPVVGLVAWGVAGPRGVVEAPSSPEHSKG